ncbi:MAG: acyl-CoA dehydrogenase family protein [Bdellovibrionota bacterium]
MDLTETTIQKELKELTRKFATEKLQPLIADDERDERFRPEIIKKLGALGLTGITVPEAYGGAGLGYKDYIIVIEELAAVAASYAISVAVSGLPQLILNIFGSEAQKTKYIPPLAKGEAVGAFSLSEAFSGSDAASLRATAKRDGDHYTLNGTKLWTTQGDFANTIILMARTGGPGPKGISAFIVEKGTPGLNYGKREKKMGCHASHTMELVLNDLKIPVGNLLGKEGAGFQIAMTALDSGRITIGATAIGIARSALDIAVSHATQREQFRKPIIQFQGVSFMLADMAVAIDAARLLTQRAAWMRDNDEDFSVQAAMAKLFASDAAMKVTTDAVQILGGAGYTQDFPLERYMREAKVLQIVEGTNQIQRVVISRELEINMKGK